MPCLYTCKTRLTDRHSRQIRFPPTGLPSGPTPARPDTHFTHVQ